MCCSFSRRFPGFFSGFFSDSQSGSPIPAGCGCCSQPSGVPLHTRCVGWGCFGGQPCLQVAAQRMGVTQQTPRGRAPGALTPVSSRSPTASSRPSCSRCCSLRPTTSTAATCAPSVASSARSATAAASSSPSSLTLPPGERATSACPTAARTPKGTAWLLQEPQTTPDFCSGSALLRHVGDWKWLLRWLCILVMPTTLWFSCPQPWELYCDAHVRILMVPMSSWEPCLCVPRSCGSHIVVVPMSSLEPRPHGSPILVGLILAVPTSSCPCPHGTHQPQDAPNQIRAVWGRRRLSSQSQDGTKRGTSFAG